MFKVNSVLIMSHYYIYVSGSNKTQTLLPSNVIDISPQGFKFCNSVEKYQLFLDGNNVWNLLEPLTYTASYLANIIHVKIVLELISLSN